MTMKDGMIGDLVMWSFLGGAAVLVLTHSSGFSTAIGSAAAPLEYETGMIATAGGNVPTRTGTNNPKSGS